MHVSLVRIRLDKEPIFYHRLGLTLVKGPSLFIGVLMFMTLVCTFNGLWVALITRYWDLCYDKSIGLVKSLLMLK